MTLKNMLKIFLMLLAIWIVSAPNAYAYIDPGSGTLLWQLLLAGMFGAIFWIHRLRLWLKSVVTWIATRLKLKRQQ